MDVYITRDMGMSIGEQLSDASGIPLDELSNYTITGAEWTVDNKGADPDTGVGRSGTRFAIECAMSVGGAGYDIPGTTNFPRAPLMVQLEPPTVIPSGEEPGRSPARHGLGDRDDYGFRRAVGGAKGVPRREVAVRVDYKGMLRDKRGRYVARINDIGRDLFFAPDGNVYVEKYIKEIDDTGWVRVDL